MSTTSTDPHAGWKPDWLAAEMPPGYRNRLEEMQRLTREIDELGRFGRLLYKVGPELADAVRDTFVALGFDVTAGAGAAAASIVALDGMRRLLVHVSASDAVIQRRSPDLASVFQMLHEQAGNDDRVVLVVNHHPETRPADRREGVDGEALGLLKRLGANFVPAPALFALWSLSLQHRDLARGYVERLHEQDGGVFVLPASLNA